MHCSTSERLLSNSDLAQEVAAAIPRGARTEGSAHARARAVQTGTVGNLRCAGHSIQCQALPCGFDSF